MVIEGSVELTECRKKNMGDIMKKDVMHIKGKEMAAKINANVNEKGLFSVILY